jgi:hypothetical protein
VLQVHDRDVSRPFENMGDKRRAQPSGDAQGMAAASEDAAAAQGGALQKQQRWGLSVDGAAAGSAEGGSCGQEASGSTLAPVTMCLSMRCDPIALAGRKAALEAALRKVATEFGGRECSVEWTRVGPSEDTLHRVLPLVLARLEPEGAVQLVQVCIVQASPITPTSCGCPIALDASHCLPGSLVVLVGLVDPWLMVDLHSLGRAAPEGCSCPRGPASLPLTAQAVHLGLQAVAAGAGGARLLRQDGAAVRSARQGRGCCATPAERAAAIEREHWQRC